MKRRKNILGLTTVPATAQLLQSAAGGYKKYMAKNGRTSRHNQPPDIIETSYLLDAAGAEYKKLGIGRNPGKFDRCVKAVKKRGGAANAYAVCTAAGTRGNKKANTAKLQRTLHKKVINFRKNKSRSNPIDSAADTYEYFHGRPPQEIVEITTEVYEHTVFSGIGKLVALEILAIDGSRIVRLEVFKGALLAQNEKRTQLYIQGGDQSVNLKDFGIADVHELEILGALTSVVYFTTKDHLRPEDGGTANYDHKFGGEGRKKKHAFGKHGSRLPLIGYDVRNKLLSIQGGGYELPAEGIDG